MSFGTDIHLSSNAVNQALGQSKAVVKDSAEAGGFDHDEAAVAGTFAKTVPEKTL